MRGVLAEFINSYTDPYIKRMTNTPSDIREHVALVDFCVKVSLTLLSAYSVRTSKIIKLGSAPGIGAMLSGIKIASKWAEVSDPIILSWKIFSSLLIELFSMNLYSGKSFKKIRDELSHGYPIPAEEVSAQSLLKSIRKFSESIRATLEKQLKNFNYEINDSLIYVVQDEDRQCVTPVWSVNVEKNIIGIYSNFGINGIYYVCPLIGVFKGCKEEEFDQFKKVFLNKMPCNKMFEKFVEDITNDISSFSEDYSTPHCYFGEDEDAGIIFIHWIKPSSERNDYCVDRFRLGQDNRYEWFDSKREVWEGYSVFLRRISNWGMLARRIRIEIEGQQRKRIENEFGGVFIGESVKRVPVNLIEENSDEHEKSINLGERVDKASLPLKTFTTVFFVVGDAGMGKTDFLLWISKNRAKQIESDPNCCKPLYIYVSSAGRALSNLEDAISNALGMTRILTNHSAKSLCRNGLLVLVVDGFDELLGSGGYDNPLGSLENWFRELRGRGVIIASARSSYYMTRYRKALSETTGLSVEHIVANFKPWNLLEAKKFLTINGVDENILEKLSEQDWALLSIPFFSNAFAVWQKSRSVHGDISSIFQIVVSLYLERESQKLIDQHGNPIITSQKLQILFSEIAEMMHLEGKRELDKAELALCAQSSLDINDLESENINLKRRLTTLCGLSTGGVVAGEGKFFFSHEVMYDCFLSFALQQKSVSEIKLDYLIRFFQKYEIHTIALEWFVLNDAVNASKILNKLLSVDNNMLIWMKNVGSLWTAILNQNHGCPPSLVANRLIFDRVSLTSSGWKSLRLSHCQINILSFSSCDSVIDLTNTVVKCISIQNNDSLKMLRNVVPENISEINTDNIFCNTTAEVRRLFEDEGVIEKSIDYEQVEWNDTATYFVDNIVMRSDYPIIFFTDSYVVATEKLNWAMRLGTTKLIEFISRLEKNKLARIEQMVTKGPSKSRLIFLVPPSEIAKKDSSNERVVKFWSGS